MQFDPTSLDALTRVLTGLHEYTIVAADDTLNSLTVKVIATATSAPCPACGEFSAAVKAVREQVVRDVPHAGRAVVLTVAKRPLAALIA
jgi:metal-sulfur cluster biosynthetic enzyme